MLLNPLIVRDAEEKDFTEITRIYCHYVGFRHVGTLDAVGFKFDKWVDTVLIAKTSRRIAPCIAC